MNGEKELTEEEKEVAARDKYGRAWKDLTPEEKEAIYVDYAGLRDILETEYGRAEKLANTDTPQGIQAGNVYVASNPLAHVGKAIGQYRGNKKMDEVQAERREISEKYGKGSQAAGEVAGNRQQQMMQMMADMMKGGQQPPPQAAPKEAPPQPPPAMPQGAQRAPMAPSQPPMMAAQNATPPQPQMPASGGPIPGNPQEWQAYMMRQDPVNFPNQKKDEEEEIMARYRALGGR